MVLILLILDSFCLFSMSLGTIPRALAKIGFIVTLMFNSFLAIFRLSFIFTQDLLKWQNRLIDKFYSSCKWTQGLVFKARVDKWFASQSPGNFTRLIFKNFEIMHIPIGILAIFFKTFFYSLKILHNRLFKTGCLLWNVSVKKHSQIFRTILSSGVLWLVLSWVFKSLRLPSIFFLILRAPTILVEIY